MTSIGTSEPGRRARRGGDPGNRLRILAVGNMYPPHHAGGYELAWQAAMRHARHRGHTVRVLTSDYRAEPGRADEDPDVHRTLQWYWDLTGYRFVHQRRSEALRLERRNLAELDRHLREFSPDVVAWWSMGCMSLSMIERTRRAGFPAVFVVHDDWLVYGWEHDAWMRAWRGRRRNLAPIAEPVCRVPISVDLRSAGPLVFNSRYTLERAGRAGIDVADARVVHPGIDTRLLAALDPRSWGWRLTYVGRIDRQKGVDTAVAALAHLPSETTLTVWGTGDEGYVAEMRRQAELIGARDRLRFAGFAGPEQLRSAYGEADVVLFPVRWEEPFGLVPIEAMAVERPVVMTLGGGTAEFARDGDNALVFDAGDARGLARCVERLADEQPLRERLRESGRRTAERFTVERFCDQTVAEIERAARLPGPAISAAPRR